MIDKTVRKYRDPMSPASEHKSKYRGVVTTLETKQLNRKGDSCITGLVLMSMIGECRYFSLAFPVGCQLYNYIWPRLSSLCGIEFEFTVERDTQRIVSYTAYDSEEWFVVIDAIDRGLFDRE